MKGDVGKQYCGSFRVYFKPCAPLISISKSPLMRIEKSVLYILDGEAQREFLKWKFAVGKVVLVFREFEVGEIWHNERLIFSCK